jgi:transposase InsO family protein
MLCDLLGLSRASYYRWRQRQTAGPTPREASRIVLALWIVLLFVDNQERPGRRPMQGLLAQQGIHASLGRIDRVMRALGLQARRGRKWRQRRGNPGPSPALTAHITNHCQDDEGTPDFTSTIPGMKTVGDITKLRTGDGAHYLATVLDLASRRVLSWQLAPVQDTALTTAVVTQARTQGFLRPGAIFHSDRGPQYTSHPFQDHCKTLTITQSLGATGVCYDNAVAESFFASLKADLHGELSPTATVPEVRGWLQQWIEDWYNTRRPHTANDGTPPAVAWDDLLTAHSAVSPT